MSFINCILACIDVLSEDKHYVQLYINNVTSRWHSINYVSVHPISPTMCPFFLAIHQYSIFYNTYVCTDNYLLWMYLAYYLLYYIHLLIMLMLMLKTSHAVNDILCDHLSVLLFWLLLLMTD